jgi:hypothetical protein
MTGTNLVAYTERFERDAQAQAAKEARSAANLSLQGGLFSLGGQTLGPTIAVVVIDSVFENNFYDETRAFDPKNPLPPICYAVSRQKKGMYPHADMQKDPAWFQPQHWPAGQGFPSGCEGCPRNIWGSSARGRGKACQNREKLFIIPGGYYTPARGPRMPSELSLFDDPKHFAQADLIGLKLPVTSGENWANYVVQLSAAHKRPSYAAYTEITLIPDQKSQFKATFQLIELLPDPLFEVICARVDAAIVTPLQGYEPPSAEQRAAAPATPSTAAGMRGGFGQRR